MVLLACFPSSEEADKTSTELTQSSCSKEARYRGGIIARTYSTESVVSDEIPLAVRYSSMEVRRKVPLIRNSKGIGFSVCNRALTRVERA